MPFCVRCLLAAFAGSYVISIMVFACTAQPTPASVVNATEMAPAGVPANEVIIWASDMSVASLDEIDFIDDSASPGGKLIGLPNSADELNPPPESDPHATFEVQVQKGIPYRCWIHMRVGEPKGRSTANIVYVQFSKSVNGANQEIFRLSTNSYLSARGPAQPGWAWVGCDAQEGESLVYFESDGHTNVRIQAGAEGVGFDQLLLSPAKSLSSPPSEAVIAK